MDGDDCLTDGDDCLTDGSDCLTDGDDCLTDGDDCLTDGDDRLTDGDDCLTARLADPVPFAPGPPGGDQIMQPCTIRVGFIICRVSRQVSARAGLV